MLENIDQFDFSEIWRTYYVEIIIFSLSKFRCELRLINRIFIVHALYLVKRELLQKLGCLMKQRRCNLIYKTGAKFLLTFVVKNSKIHVCERKMYSPILISTVCSDAVLRASFI